MPACRTISDHQEDSCGELDIQCIRQNTVARFMTAVTFNQTLTRVFFFSVQNQPQDPRNADTQLVGAQHSALLP